MLLFNRKKVIFFNDIRIINMQIKNAIKEITKSRFIINKKIYVTLKLINNDNE